MRRPRASVVTRSYPGHERQYPHSFAPIELSVLGEFLASASLVVPLRQIAEGVDFVDVVGLRHDVDHNLDHAVRLAEWEADRGFRSSFYVLPYEWYADLPSYLPNLRRIQELGHEVGVHNNCVALTWTPDDPIDGAAHPGGTCAAAADLLRSQIEGIRAEGIDIVGTAAHGDARCREHGIHNNDIWAAGYTLADFGLTYEAYHLNNGRYYVSDNRGEWQGPRELRDGVQTIVSTHPEHWEIP